MQYSQNKDHQHHKWQRQKSWISFPSRLPGCAGQAADAVSAFTQVKWRILPNYRKFHNRSVQTFGFVYHDTNGRNHGPVWKTQSFLLGKIGTVILWRDCYGKGKLRKSYCNTIGRRFPTRTAYSYTVKEGYSYLCMWMTSKWLARNKTLIRCGKNSIKQSSWEHQHLPFIMYVWNALKDNVKLAKILWTITEPCLNHEFPREELKNLHTPRIFVSLHGPMMWKVMPRNVWNNSVS